MKESRLAFFFSLLSTFVCSLSEFFLIRLLVNKCSEEVVSSFISYLNLISYFSLLMVHALIFNVSGALIGKLDNEILSFLKIRLRWCVAVCSFVSFLFIIPFTECSLSFWSFLLILWFSFSYMLFWGENGVCLIKNKMTTFFCVVISHRFLLYFSACVLIPVLKSFDSILIAYSVSYFLICFLLDKILFSKNGLLVSFFEIKNTNRLIVQSDWSNLNFDIVTYLPLLLAFYASVFWKSTDVLTFCLFWRFTECGKIFLDRFVDSQQGVIANLYIKDKRGLTKLFYKIFIRSFITGLLGGILYLLIGKNLMSFWLNSDVVFKIPNSAWVCGGLFYIKYSICSVIKGFAFYTNNAKCLQNVLYVNVILFFVLLLLLHRSFNVFLLICLPLSEIIFVPFYWKALNRKLKLSNVGSAL